MKNQSRFFKVLSLIMGITMLFSVGCGGDKGGGVDTGSSVESSGNSNIDESVDSSSADVSDSATNDDGSVGDGNSDDVSDSVTNNDSSVDESNSADVSDSVTNDDSSVSDSSSDGTSDGEHQHTFDQQVEKEEFLQSEAPCVKKYYYSCACGEKGEEIFSVKGKGLHDYTATVAGDAYVKTEATCQKQGEYYMSCSACGRSSAPYGKTFIGGELGDHDYSQKVASAQFIATEATYEEAATYYKSCICGLKGTETFTDGEPLRDLSDAEKEGYRPVSLTMTLYDPENSIYGFTYNTQEKPLRPVLQIEKGNTVTENALEVDVTYSKWSSYDENDETIYYYVSKAEIELEPLTTYTYRVYDKYAGVGTDPVTFQTRDLESTSFSFSHVSDSQSVPSSGAYFRDVLGQIDTDFILHTGDVVEYSKYEYEWTDMLHSNFEYLSKMPIMALPGNHDTTYKAGSSELTKHFNNKIPEQSSTLTGYYYSFTYGNAKFIMLNTNNNSSGALDAEQYDWLINELETNDCDWTIVGMHAPLYSIGQWGANPEKNGQSMALRAQLKGVFAEYGVDLVLQGHDHLLSRTKPIDKDGNPIEENWQEDENGVSYSVDPSGVIYVMNGTVGSTPKSVVAVEEGIYEYASACATRTWADITIDGDTLTVEAKYYTGLNAETYYKWGIKKSA